MNNGYRDSFVPAYLRFLGSKGMQEKNEKLRAILESCVLCPRRCRVNRLKGELGFCRGGKEPEVSSYGPHFGEEPELVGQHGSGTIFLAHCNLRCVYCQNYDISHLGEGEVCPVERLAGMMLRLQNLGCHNINLVTPTHYAPQIVEALTIAAAQGLRLPLVWNCSGYEDAAVIRLLEGIVDIYMPDIKYGRNGPAEKYSGTPDYFERCRQAVQEMHRQVGDLTVDERGIACRGLLVRHLVLPQDLAGSAEVFRFIAQLSKDTYVNIMDQYRPCGEAGRYEKLNRRVTTREYARAIALARKEGLYRGFPQQI